MKWNISPTSRVASCVAAALLCTNSLPMENPPAFAQESSTTGVRETAAEAARRPITYETLYGRETPNFRGSAPTGLRWDEAGEFLVQRRGAQYWQIEPVSEKETLIRDLDEISKTLGEQLHVDEPQAKDVARGLHFHKDGQRAWFQYQNDLYRYTSDDEVVHRLTNDAAEEEFVEFSPNGKYIAYVKMFNLYCVPFSGEAERQLTHDGTSTLRNGQADWVYYEEVYHRNWKAYHWSPDSRHIVFEQFDDRGREQFTVADYRQTLPTLEIEYYPKAGHQNPAARVGAASVDNPSVQWLAAPYDLNNLLVTGFGWWDNDTAYYYVQDRAQKWLDVVRVPLSTNEAETLFRDRTEAWVEPPGDPTILPDETFLLPSERDGFRHLYHFQTNGELIRQVTAGPWEVRTLHGVSDDGWIYFSGTKDSSLTSHLYRIRLDGTDLSRMTPEGGDHHVELSLKKGMYVDAYSDPQTPPMVALRSVNGEVLRVIYDEVPSALSEYELLPVEFHTIPARDGCELEATVIRPPNFDASQKYPVWLLTYGGPHAPTVSGSWAGGRLYEQMLAHMGIIAFRVDPRSASGKGAQSAWTCYRQFGVQEVADIEDALDWLADQGGVDEQRIGMSGHSYGGYLTAYCMTHTQRFAAGISGAPVTDWHNYDTIYTERYMDTPQENPDGYRNSSVVPFADQLHGRLLLLHGARDDNVHFANSIQLIDALQKADKQFELMVYPPYFHGVYGSHYNHLTVNFIRRTMLDAPTGE